MPDGRPAPYLMTLDELIEFLRIESRFPGQTVRYYREKYGLKAIQIGKYVRFRLTDVLHFLDKEQERNPR